MITQGYLTGASSVRSSGHVVPGEEAKPRTWQRDYISHLAWGCPSVPPDKLEVAAGEREIWISLIRLLPRMTRQKR